MTRERIRLTWLLSCCLLSLNRHWVVHLYTQVDARRFTESRPAHKRVRLGFYPFLSYNTSYISYGGLCLWALIRLWALGLRVDLLRKVPYSLTSWASMCINHYGYNPAPPGRFILSSNIPNIRPQIDLNLFMSIFNT